LRTMEISAWFRTVVQSLSGCPALGHDVVDRGSPVGLTVPGPAQVAFASVNNAPVQFGNWMYSLAK